MLKPDTDPLHSELKMIGKKHKRLGVKMRHLFAFEKAFMYAMEELLEDDFKKADRRAWEIAFQFFVGLMQDGIERTTTGSHRKSRSSYM